MDTNTVEIIGPPGVGKTTVYRLLCARWKPASNWIYQEALLSPKPSLRQFKSWLNYQVRSYLGKKPNRHIPADFGTRFINHHHAFASFSWLCLNNGDPASMEGMDKKFRWAYNLFADFCRYQAIQEKNYTKPCVICEGFMQKSFLVQQGSWMEQNRAKYCNLIPVPRAVIYININNSEVILNRLLQRKKVIASHRGIDSAGLLADIERWQHLLGSLSQKMQEQGVKLFCVDGMLPAAENAGLISRHLDSLHYSG